MAEQESHDRAPTQKGNIKGKQAQAIKEEFGNVAKARKDGVRKAKGQLELRLSRNLKGKKKSFYDQISSKRLNKENVRPLLNGAVV